MKQPSYVGFKSKEYHWKPDIDYRENPHLYKVGRGQQGVLICQPYKSELHRYGEEIFTYGIHKSQKILES
jgi:hypothetical protein